MLKENITQNKFRKNILFILASTFTLPLFLFFSCASNKAYKNPAYEIYKTFDLRFTFMYPISWVIFEHENEVAFSNNVILLTTPKSERRFTPHAFLGTLNLSNSPSTKLMHSALMQNALFLSLVRDSTFTSKEKPLVLTKLQKLSNTITEDSYATLQNSYQSVFNAPLNTHVRGYTTGNTALLIQSFLKSSNDVIDSPENIAKKSQKEIVIHILGLRKITNEIFVTITGDYHTGILTSENADDLLPMAETQYLQKFLQDFVDVLKSVEINTPPSEE